ncbi:MAG: archaetidylinositol phosphate synthase [Candidatus Nezhaarchaeota archaeon]|nr:archaetidylinositol phosphate synthase [Candidatus Nezhaarchaeota archaeon]MCX8142575.1 archaetidylinositol phosphate synthase [Candidatus Nezhaarchaeota archaeon]
MLTKLKNIFQELIAREAKIIRKIGLKANVISLLGLILGILSGLLYWAAGTLHANLDAYRAYLILAFLLLLFSGMCDALDGALARIYGEVTTFGSFLDSIADRYVDSIIILGLIMGGLCEPVWGVLALIGSLLTSYTRARAEAIGVAMESIGLVERAERIIIILISSIIEILWPFSSALHIGIIILAITSNFTVFQRILHFYKEASRVSK